MVHLTWTRAKWPWYSRAKSKGAMSPQGLVTMKPSSVARVMKQSSAHSPRALAWRMFIPGFFNCVPGKMDFGNKKRGRVGRVVFFSLVLFYQFGEGDPAKNWSL